MARTVQQVRDHVRTYFDMEPDDLPDVLIDGWIREAQVETLAIRRAWPHLATSTEIVRDSATDEYPAGVDTVAHVRGPSGKLNVISAGFGRDYFGEGTATQEAYATWGGNIIFFPSGLTGTYTVYGYRSPVTPFAAGSTWDLPEAYHEFLLDYVMHKTYLFDDDPEMADSYLSSWQRGLDSLARREFEGPEDEPLILGGGPKSNFNALPAPVQTPWGTP